MTTQVLTSTTPDVLWLTVNPGMQRLDHKLLTCLARHTRVQRWAYTQTPDEPCSLEVALTLLHDYIKGLDRPIHLAGHSTGGLLGLLYARRFPRRVKSLTLLSVGVNPAVDWQAHYYTQLELLPCSRTRILTQMVYTLLGPQPPHLLQGWVELLEQDLIRALSFHSLTQRFSVFPAGVPVPLLVCGSRDDAVVDPMQIQGWQPWLEPGDRVWFCQSGRHFFHASHFNEVAHEMLDFWNQSKSSVSLPVYLESAN